MSADGLRSELHQALAGRDPVPAHVLAAGRSALSWRTPGAALAGLTADVSTADGTRGASARLITFSRDDVQVEIEVNGSGGEREIVGQITPACPGQVAARSPHGTVTSESEADGGFVLPGVPPGPISLLFRRPNLTSVVTSWVNV